MAELGDAVPRLQQTSMWFNSLDPGVQRVLNDIAARAPQAVAEVIGGPDASLVRPPEGTSLGDHLQAVSRQGGATGLGGTPAEVTFAQPFQALGQLLPHGSALQFIWAEQNLSDSASSGPRRAKVIVQDETGTIVGQVDQLNPPLPRGSTEKRAIRSSGIWPSASSADRAKAATAVSLWARIAASTGTG